VGSATLREIVAQLDRRYPRSWAEPWDAVGLTCGDLDRQVNSILFAIDPAPAVVDEAVERRADLLITHHPLFLTPVSAVSTETTKGRTLHRLVEAGCALFTAHTNADVARPGVSDALADALGLLHLEPLAPSPGESTDKIVAFVPPAHVDGVIDALAAAGAGTIGHYERCAWSALGVGTFEPGHKAAPVVGQVGQREQVEERRVEMVMPRQRRAEVVAALLESHPYEEPAFDVFERAELPGGRGLGRVGQLPEPMDLSAFVRLVADSLVVGAGGVRATGDPTRAVSRVAVCGGAGDSLLDAVRRAGVDAYVTGDLRHHRAGEFSDESGTHGPALIDATHFGTEYPWLSTAAALLADDLASGGATVDIAVSTAVTDPWTLHAADERSSS
jgi:dinuclear metal center YbgI/SA1388 family protein